MRRASWITKLEWSSFVPILVQSLSFDQTDAEYDSVEFCQKQT